MAVKCLAECCSLNLAENLAEFWSFNFGGILAVKFEMSAVVVVDHTTADGLDYIATWNAAMLDGEAIRTSYMAKAQGETPEYDALLPVKKVAGE